MSSNDLAPLGCVFDGDNIQRDDEVAPDSFNDIDAVAFCLSYKGDVSDLGAKDRKHLYGCAIATLVACMGYGDDSPHAQQLAWDFLNGLEGGDNG
tara:strand:+ start:936 stop:1220 length:285 start_codon:yes stop_codon:yes gene_type:complete